MFFSDTVFLFFILPVTLVLYYAASFSKSVQNYVLLAAGLFFYAWLDPGYVLLFIGIALADWLLGLFLRTQNQLRNRILMILGVIMNVGMMVYFIYAEFVLEQINLIGERDLVPYFSVIAPVALPFFILHSISYLADIYRQVADAQKNPAYVMLYLFFFPKMLYGPIVKYRNFAPGLRERETSPGKTASGIFRILIGLAKYTYLAKYLGRLSDAIFNWSEFGTAIVEVSVLTAWLGVIAYSLYVYFFYSAFSDIAIGFARIFGFDFMENFNCPYQATSITDFWKRWHISLAEWFKTYVYRIKDVKKLDNMDTMVKNLFAMWALIGIWHGAGWNTLFWGAGIFALILMERFFRLNNGEHKNFGMRVYTLFAVAMGWVLVRTDSLYHASIYFRNLFGVNSNQAVNAQGLFLLKEYGFFILTGIVICLAPRDRIKEKLLPLREKIPAKLSGKKNAAAAIFCCVVFASLTAFSVLNLLFTQADFAMIGRHLLRIDSVKDAASWVEDTQEDLNDNMILADFCINTDGLIHKVLFKKELNGFSVLSDDSGMLYQGTLYNEPLSFVDDMSRQTYMLNQLVEETGGKLIVLIPPSKLIYGVSEADLSLPLTNMNPAMDKYFLQLQQRQIDYIDFRILFKDSGLPHDRLYFRTDHRWKPYAAFLATQELIRHLAVTDEIDLDPDGYYTNISNYNTISHGNSVLGSFGRRVGTAYCGYDSFDLIYPLNYRESNYTWTREDDDLEMEETGNLLETLVADQTEMDEFFRVQDGLLYPYMEEFHEEDTIVNNNDPDGVRVAVLCDYYFAPMACYLAPMCGKIEMYSIRDDHDQSNFVEKLRDSHFDLVIMEMRSDSLKAGTLALFDEED